MKRVVIKAPLLSMSGYGVHSRQVFKWLKKQRDIEVVSHLVPWGNTSWMLEGGLEGNIVNDIMSTSAPAKGPVDLSIQIQLPNEWDPQIAPRNVGISACVETDRCNPTWISCCNKMTRVVVPTNHIKDTLCRTGSVTSPLSVVPEAFFPELVDGKFRSALDLKLTTSFNFLMVGQITGGNPWNDRKNTFLTLKWLCETFKDDPEVGIILKTNSGRGTTIDRKVTRDSLKKALSECRKGPYPKVYLLHGNMTNDEMSSLYKEPTIKCFVSLTRGEGFGLPILEAAVSGIPVIATGWSGHLDFLSLGKFIPVDYKLVDIHQTRIDNAIFMSGSKWAEPSEDDAKRKIKRFRESHTVPKQWATELAGKLINSFSQESIERSYDSAIGNLLR